MAFVPNSELEIAKRAKALLFAGQKQNYLVDDQLFCFNQLGEYLLHYDDSSGLTINQEGAVHGTIFRQNPRGSFEQCCFSRLPELLKTLRRAMILDDLAGV